jgi:hypothetical protein
MVNDVSRTCPTGLTGGWAWLLALEIRFGLGASGSSGFGGLDEAREEQGK